MPDGAADPQRQLTVMNFRVAALVAVDPAGRELAGDQLYLDLDLSTVARSSKSPSRRTRAAKSSRSASVMTLSCSSIPAEARSSTFVASTRK
jgi:hypothetical protein